MATSKLFKAFLYLALLAGSIVFVEKTLTEFLTGACSYTDSQEALSGNDLPSYQLCYYYQNTEIATYEQDFYINVTVSQPKVIR